LGGEAACQVSQFYSDLSVVDVNGNEKYRKRISVRVRRPLHFSGRRCATRQMVTAFLVGV
jgi:cytochrome c biogenesis protein ResB